VTGDGFGALWPWVLLGVYGLALVVFAPVSRDAGGFYRGRDRHGRLPTLG